MATWIDIDPHWAFLEPWTRVLKRQLCEGLRGIQPSPLDSTQLYLAITYPAVQDEARKVQEGLKLLAAVAYVDYNAWKYLLINHCGVKPRQPLEEFAEYEIVARFQLRMCSNDHTVNDIVQMCGVQQLFHLSREYSEALAKIAAMDKNRYGIEIRIPIEVLMTKEIGQQKSLDELLRLRSAWEGIRQGWEERSLTVVGENAFRCTFVLCPTKVKLEEYRIDLDMAKKMKDFIRDNVWVSSISLKLDLDDKLKRYTRPTMEILGQLLTSLVETTRHSCESPTRYLNADSHAPLKRQQISIAKYSRYMHCPKAWEAICSAAIQSETTRELKLSYVVSSCQSRHWWAWLAYAFFSKRARSISSLEVLTLKQIENMATSEIEAFRAILASDCPEEVLLRYPSGSTRVQDGTLAAGSPIRWDFNEKNVPVFNSDVLISPSPIPFLRVVSGSEESEWVDAIAPGYGRCQVRRENLVLTEHVDSISPGNTLKALKIYFSRRVDVSINGLQLFFATIGSSLKALTIDTGDVHTHVRVNVKMILESCPNLELLCLERCPEVAVFNFSEYHAVGSPVPEPSFDFDDFLRFTEELMNTDSALMKCLQRLTIQQSYDPRATHLEFEWKLNRLLKMLENNDHLEYLCIELLDNFEEHVEKFRKFHLQPINRFKLDVQSKIAFLSVLSITSRSQNEKMKRGRQVKDKRRNWEHLDANVVTNIFQFAEVPVLQKVYISVSS